MSWTHKNAEFHGDVQNIKTGDKVVICIENLDDPDDPLTKEFEWGYDEAEGLTPGQFRDMVIAETEAHLAHLNDVKPITDVSHLYIP